MAEWTKCHACKFRPLYRFRERADVGVPAASYMIGGTFRSYDLSRLLS